MLEAKVWLLLLLSLGLFLETTVSANKDFNKNCTLVFVQVMYRHGDRNPIKQTLGDPYDETYWPRGFAQLTTLGEQQQRRLGQFFRKRYSDLLSSEYVPNEIYIRSSDVDRTLMSAYSNLGGLYPSKCAKNCNSQVLSQPIPVHTQPVSIDYLTAGAVPTPCSNYVNALNAYKNSPGFLAELNNASYLFDIIAANVNATFDKAFVTLLTTRDGWVCDTAHNYSIREWAEPLFYNNTAFYKAALRHYFISNNTPYLCRFYAGYLLADILGRFSSKAAKTLVPDRKFWVYSTHDSTIMGFLNCLGVPREDFPEYTATVIMELYLCNGKYYVKLLYKNLYDKKPITLELPGCEKYCPLEQMYQLYNYILPKNPLADECTNNNPMMN